ncbi:hypothetical protein [Persicirhabdus sediminis]|uniref:Uncharacterized protein n=1 Tax=Persicirhabdus sediminis TaxID=454144 RepID=A0A8J7MCR1_9BACT|nr:hypothetical protein [Persicirhabdus sediminis]MBK1790686.1 hypothetical protein [Persicirhabdus sediminis]
MEIIESKLAGGGYAGISNTLAHFFCENLLQFSATNDFFRQLQGARGGIGRRA